MAYKLDKKEVVRMLDDLVKHWPDDVWLFAADGQIYMMRCGKNGERVYTDQGGVDQSYIFATFDIPADGGDW